MAWRVVYSRHLELGCRGIPLRTILPAAQRPAGDLAIETRSSRLSRRLRGHSAFRAPGGEAILHPNRGNLLPRRWRIKAVPAVTFPNSIGDHMTSSRKQQNRPEPESSRPTDYRKSHLTKSDDYHATFKERPHQALIWQLEQRTLASIMVRHFPTEKPRHLDFACGTGRILAFLESRCSSSTGVDVSASMLSVASTNSPNAEVLEADLTRDNVLKGRKFDLITAFRFFPNAEDQLRADAIAALAPLLSGRGIIVLNNHMNRSSLLRSTRGALGRKLGHSMSIGEVENLCSLVGLRIDETLGLGILPLSDRHMLAPRVIGVTEGILAKARVLSRLAQVQLFVAVND